MAWEKGIKTYQENGGVCQVGVDLENFVHIGDMRIINTEQVADVVTLDRVLFDVDDQFVHFVSLLETYGELMIESTRISELRPSCRAPHLLPAGIGIPTGTVSAMDQRGHCSI